MTRQPMGVGMAAHVTETHHRPPTLSPDLESVLSSLLDGAVARGELSQDAAHAVFLAAWHLAATPDDHAERNGVGRLWTSALRRAGPGRARPLKRHRFLGREDNPASPGGLTPPQAVPVRPVLQPSLVTRRGKPYRVTRGAPNRGVSRWALS